MLKAIAEGLNDQLQRPDENYRQKLASTFPGIFQGCIRVGDVKEFQIQQLVDQVKERIRTMAFYTIFHLSEDSDALNDSGMAAI